MNAATPIILVLLGLGSFFIFRWFSRKVVRKPTQDRQVRLARISSASMLFQVAIGIIIILGFYSMQATFHDMALSTTPVFIGLLIIFVAWIMDEGRKIQEEQELTV
jgi:protein-S-isoprenylcysteine O-methyltransferase Ste14